MPKKDKETKKKEYFEQLLSLVQQYPKIIVVNVDHVGSKQIADIRGSLRGKGVILMGKNTKIRKCLNSNKSKIPHMEKLVEIVKLNIGFVFCIADPAEVLKIILDNKVRRRAREGLEAPCAVQIPAGPTGVDPSQTSYFQAVGINTKIVKLQIEIQQVVDLIAKGSRVTASQADLLQKLDIKPFLYGLQPVKVFDNGSMYGADMLTISDDYILEKFSAGVTNVAAFSRAIGYPTQASISHSIIEGFRNCTAVALETGFEFAQMKKIKEMLENPEAYAVAAPVAAAAAPEKAAAKAPEPEPEKEDSDDDVGLGDLFG